MINIISYAKSKSSSTANGGGTSVSTSTVQIEHLQKQIDSLSKYWQIDSSGNLFTNYNAYSNGWISALGSSSNSSTSQTATNLSELRDVSISSPIDGQSLVFDGTSWINKTVSSGGGSMTRQEIIDTLQISNWALQSTKPTYSWSEILSRPTSLPASDVYDWAKATTKPTYSWSEILSKPTKLSDFIDDLGTSPTHTHSQYAKTVKVGSTSYNSSNGIVSLPAYPTTLPASDVYDWAKAATKPTYTTKEVTENTNLYFTNARAKSAVANLYLPLSGGTVTGSLSVSGSIVCENEITAMSDRNYKKDIKPLEYKGGLSPKTFRWKYILDEDEHIGFIAQEVEELYPQLVCTINGARTLNYQALTAVLSAQNNLLEERVKNLELRLSELENKLK